MARYQAKSEQYFQNILSNFDSKSTKAVINGAIKTFKNYLIANGINANIDIMLEHELADQLRSFVLIFCLSYSIS